MSVAQETRDRRRYPWGLVGMVALVLLAESFVSRHKSTFMTPHERDWEASGTAASLAAAGPVRDARVLIFGDSMLKFGVSPRILGSRLKAPVFSLAMLDGKPAASYYLLRRALEAGARPGTVLVDFQPECMYQPPRSLADLPSGLDPLTENRHWKAMLSPREALDLAWTCRDAVFLGRTLMARVFPSYKCREEVRKAVLLALAGSGSDIFGENTRIRRNRALNRGGLLLAKQPFYRGELPQAIAAKLFAGDWFSRPEQTLYVRRFVGLAERYGIPVVWVIPPNVPEAERTRERVGMAERYDRFIAGVQRRYANLSVIDARRSGFDHTLFVDPVHLDRDGALALSEAIAVILSGHRAGSPRWVNVPPVRRPVETIALEDVDQSGAAIRARASARRR